MLRREWTRAIKIRIYEGFLLSSKWNERERERVRKLLFIQVFLVFLVRKKKLLTELFDDVTQHTQ
jgi:hypothetical protein